MRGVVSGWLERPGRNWLLAVSAITLLGVLLRVNHWLGQRAFWYDELSVIVNLMSRSYSELGGDLAADQVAPYGFLVVLKWLGETFGYTELVLRLPALVAGIASLVLFAVLSRRLLGFGAAILACLLFATANWLVYYAAETKQYGVDVLACALLYSIAVPAVREWSGARVALLGAVGLAAVWFSHPAAFVLGSIGTILFLQQATSRQRTRAGVVAGVSVVWLAGFAAHLYLTWDAGVMEAQRGTYWTYAFMPLPPTSADDVRWYFDAFLGLFSRPLEFETPGLAAVVTAIGLWSFWARERMLAAMLALPLLFALAASSVSLYPFTGRLLLFAVPSLLLLFSEGAATLASWAWPRSRAVVALAAGVLLFYPLGETVMQAAAPQPYLREGLPEVLAYVQRYYERGDAVYVYGAAASAFDFYAPRYGLEDAFTVYFDRSGDDLARYRQSLESVACEPRSWIIFAHIPRIPTDDERLALHFLDGSGERARQRVSQNESPLRYNSLHGASAYLYLTPPERIEREICASPREKLLIRSTPIERLPSSHDGIHAR